jgi:hypothetical protein
MKTVTVTRSKNDRGNKRRYVSPFRNSPRTPLEIKPPIIEKIRKASDEEIANEIILSAFHSSRPAMAGAGATPDQLTAYVSDAVKAACAKHRLNEAAALPIIALLDGALDRMQREVSDLNTALEQFAAGMVKATP